MSAQELTDAAEKLRVMPGPKVVVFRSEPGPGEVATNHMIAVCRGDHTGEGIDRYGCCQDCTFIGGYDPELVAAVASLLRAKDVMARFLESWRGIDVPEDGPMVDDYRHALNLARAINGSAS